MSNTQTQSFQGFLIFSSCLSFSIFLSFVPLSEDPLSSRTSTEFSTHVHEALTFKRSRFLFSECSHFILFIPSRIQYLLSSLRILKGVFCLKFHLSGLYFFQVAFFWVSSGLQLWLWF